MTNTTNDYSLKTFTGGACQDCVMVIANGDDSGIADIDLWCDMVHQTDPTEHGRWTVVVTDDGESSWFAWSYDCDYCGTAEAGDRFEITFIENN